MLYYEARHGMLGRGSVLLSGRGLENKALLEAGGVK